MIQRVSRPSFCTRGAVTPQAALLLLLALTFRPAGLAAAPLRISPSAAPQLQAILGIKTSRTTMQNKIDSRLFMALLHQRNDSRLAPLTDFRFISRRRTAGWRSTSWSPRPPASRRSSTRCWRSAARSRRRAMPTGGCAPVCTSRISRPSRGSRTCAGSARRSRR